MIFLSYSRADSLHLADRLAARLIRSGQEVWLDRQDIRIGHGWSQSVESAVDSCSKMIALITPGSYQSPICRGEQLRALRKNKPVLPLRAGDADLPVYLEGANYLPLTLDPADDELNKLVQEVGIHQGTSVLKKDYIETPYQTAPPRDIRPLPRAEQATQLRDYLLEERESRVVAIVGMGGLGKTFLARQLIDDPVIQAAFHDGLLWATFGREVDEAVQLEQLQEFAKALKDQEGRYSGLRGAKNQLRTTLKSKAALLILDDVWEREHVQEFLVDASRCRILITTRSADVADAVEATTYTLPPLSPEQSLELIGLKCGRKVADLPPEASDIVKLSDGLPMTLALVGSSLRRHADETDSWTRWRGVLERGEWDAFEQDNPQRKNSRVLDVLQTSWELLSPEERECFLDLAVFPKNTGITRSAIEALIGRPASTMMRRWINLSLARQVRRDEIGLHSLQADFVRDRRTDCSGLHQRLAVGMAEQLRKDSDVFFADAYLPHWYAYHLRKAGNDQEAEDLLKDPNWLRNKLRRKDLPSLSRDFSGAKQEFSRAIGVAIASSSHVLRDRPSQLSSQLSGRLRGSKTQGVQGFLERLFSGELESWLEPLTPSLTEPGSPLLRLLSGDHGEIRSLALAADGLVVAGCSDGMIRTWALADGSPAAQQRAHLHSILSLAVSPNGRSCATVSEGGSIRVWTVDRLAEVARFNLPQDWSCSALTFTSDSTLVVSGDDCMIRVFDANRLALRDSIDTQGHRVRCLTALDAETVVTGATDDTIRIWHLSAGKPSTALLGHRDTVRSIRVLSNSMIVSGADDRKVIIWDLGQGCLRQILSGPEAELTAVAADPPRGLVFGASADGLIYVWDLSTNLELQHYRAHSERSLIHCIVHDPHSGQLLTGASDRTIRVWDISAAAESVLGVEHDNPVYAIDISDDGRIAVSGGDDARVRIWRIDENTVTPGPVLTGHKGEIRGIALSPDGSRVVSGSWDSTVRLWDTASALELACVSETAGRVKAVAMMPRSRTVLAGGTHDVVVRWHQDNPNQPIRLVGHGGDIEAIAVNGSETVAISGSGDHTVRLWDLTSNCLLHTFYEHSDVVREVAISENGEWAVSGSEDGQLLVWDLNRRSPCRRLEGHRAGIYALALTPDGRLAVSGAFDRTIRVWDVQSGAQLAEFEVGGTVHACAVSRDGSTIVAGDELGHVHFLKLRGARAHTAAA